MSRRQSLDRPGILSPPGPFLTPSPSPSISASPRLQPSPSLSPFPQDVLLVTNNTITNTTQEQERKAATPGRRPSIHQLSGSPNAGTVVFQPSPSQSPAAATTVIGVTGNEFNTTLVGSNNISLNKKGGKRTAQSYAGYGQAASIVTAASLAASNLASSPKGSSKKATILPSSMISAGNSPLTGDSPISSPNSLKPPTPQPMMQQLPVVNAGNQLLQFIQGPQLIAAASQAANQQRSHMMSTGHIHQNSNSHSSSGSSKSSRGPQQILPKPQQSSSQSSDKTLITQSKTMTVQQSGQISQSPQPQNSVNTSATQSQGGQILLPTGNLNTQPLLLNQMPVIVQQNTPQGVQFILRPPTPQLAGPSLVIHNTRPQLQQPQPQQLLRILNTNGAMQLAAAPTFIVSSQANLIQQNLQTIKANTQTTPITQLSSLQSRPQQLAAAINSHIIGQSVAHLQNLQLNGNLAQIQMPNGLNGPIISQLPHQFQQSLGGFNQLNQNLNLNQLNSTNLQQIAAAAAAAGAAFQSPPPPQVSELQMPSVVPAQNIQFSTNSNSINAVNQPIGITSPTVTPQPQLIPSVTPEPVRNPTPVLQNIVAPQATTTVLVQSDNIGNAGQKVNAMKINEQPEPTVKVKKTPKSRKKKIQPAPSTAVVSICPATMTTTTATSVSGPTTTSSSSSQSSRLTSTGKLDLANVMKLCGIMEDDDYMDAEDPPIEHHEEQQKTVIMSHQQQQQQQVIHHQQIINAPVSTASTPSSSDFMITIPSQNSDIPFTLTIPTSQCDKMTSIGNLTSGIGATATYSNSDIKNSNNMETQNIVIKIDQNESGQPFTISIPRVQGDEVPQQQTVQIVQQQQQQQQPSVHGQNIVQSSQQTTQSTMQQQSMSVNQSINTHKPTVSIAVSSFHPTSATTTPTNSNVLCVTSFVNSVGTHPTPTLQSQINEIQNQLMGVNNNGNPGSQHINISSGVIMPHTITTTTTTAAIKPRRKPAVKRNGKKVETIPTSVGNVPSQIGNIQISQVDATKIANQNLPISNVVENKIQIMPILDNKVGGGLNSSNNQQQQQQSQHHSHQQHQTAQIQTAIINQQQQQQQQQQTSHIQNPIMLQTSLSQTTQNQQSVLVTTSGSLEPTTSNSKVQTEPSNLHHRNQQQVHTSQTITGNVLPVTTSSGAALIPHLTGSLSLAYSDDGNGRLLLRHDPNSPQDPSSQIILQAIISGALPNVTIINESYDKNRVIKNFSSAATNIVNPPASANQNVSTTKVSLPQIQPTNTISKTVSNVAQSASQTQITTQQQQTHANATATNFSGGQTSGGNDNNHGNQKRSVIEHNRKSDTSSNIQNQSIPTQQTIVVNPNSTKLVALPKIDVNNQQLFSLNTITNQITQINPGQTNAALGAMEKLLIVPAGITAQQLAQCLSQGQIHFDNIGQAQSPQVQAAPRVQQQIVHPQQHQPVQPLQQVQQTKQVANVAPIIDTSKAKLDPKPRKPKPRKPKICNENLTKTIKPMQKLDLTSKTNTNPVQIVQPNTTKDHNLLRGPSSGVSFATSTSTSVSSNIHPFQTQAGTTKLIGVTAPMQQISQHRSTINNQCNNSNLSNNSTSNINTIVSNQSNAPPNTSSIVTSQVATTSTSNTPISTVGNSNINNNNNNTPRSQSLGSNAMPPLVSMNVSQTLPRVQTIQLTPQQQQLLQTVQMQIQQLSAKLQNKSLLTTLNIPPDFDPNNPLNNKPLPSLNNIQNMTDTEIHAALRRLFIEQQKILASGKVIPTIPAPGPHAFVPAPLIQNQSPMQSSGGCDVAPTAVNNPVTFSNTFSNKSAPVSGTSMVQSVCNKSEGQPIPANIVQPNNHNSTNATATTTQRIHIYPMQHQNVPQKTIQHVTQQQQQQQQQQQSQQQTIQQQPQPSQPQTKLQKEIQCQAPINQLSLPSLSPQLPNLHHHQKVVNGPEYSASTVTTTPKPEPPIVDEEKPQIPPAPPVPLASPKPKIPRHSLFERQLQVDQDGCTKPDYVTPFQSKRDAVRRLISYHCLYERDEEILSDEDDEFEKIALNLQGKFKSLTAKYQQILLQESMRLHRSSELYLINKLLLTDVQKELLEMRAEATQSNNSYPGGVISNSITTSYSSCRYVKKDLDMPMQTPTIPHQYVHQQTQPHHPYQEYNQSQHNPNQMYHYNSQLQNARAYNKTPVDGYTNIKSEIKSEPCDLVFDKCDNMNINSKYNNRGDDGKLTSSCAQSCSNSLVSDADLLQNAVIKDEKDILQNHTEYSNHSATASLGVTNSSSLQNCDNIRNSENNENVKKELDQFDIESEITPSFIMKKVDHATNDIADRESEITSKTGIGPAVNSHIETGPSNTNEFTIDYFANSANQQNTFSSALPFTDNIESLKRKDDQLAHKNEQYDEWLCIQKELNLISEKKQESAMVSNHINQDQEQHTHHSASKAVEKHLSDIFESNSKGVENQLSDLFTNNVNNGATSKEQQQLVANNMHLSDLFNPDSISNKSVETRLEAMFGESPVEKPGRDMVDDLFHDSSATGEEMHSNTLSGNVQQHYPLMGPGNKRHWNSNNDLMSPNASSSPMNYAKRSCMAAEYMEESHITSNHPRWMIDQQFDFITSHSSNLPADGNGSDDMRKRSWNGDLISNAIEQGASKKMCFNNKPEADLDQDLLGLHSTSPAEAMANEIMRHTMQQHNSSLSGVHLPEGNHQYSHIQVSAMMNMQTGSMHHHIQQHHQLQGNSLLGPSSGTNMFESNLNTSGNANLSGGSSGAGSMSSNFDEDINRHVQNAIDSILNLQNSESDSLNFSLDHSMGSFLADSPLGQQHNSVGGTVVQTTSGSSHCIMTSGKQRSHARIDDLSDCLISGGDNSNMMVDSPSSVMSNTAPGSNSGIPGSIADFSCVAGIDEAVKSIMTS